MKNRTTCRGFAMWLGGSLLACGVSGRIAGTTAALLTTFGWTAACILLAVLVDRCGECHLPLRIARRGWLYVLLIRKPERCRRCGA